MLVGALRIYYIYSILTNRTLGPAGPHTLPSVSSAVTGLVHARTARPGTIYSMLLYVGKSLLFWHLLVLSKSSDEV